ncbi:MAG TPA: NusA-like transcription termination signal-binding factor [Candidatus Nanoarchaeia archaeon]|nr:NusA-like transcription termination signal-binding factor [Candidatus Nanoarchaeia archaeon]
MARIKLDQEMLGLSSLIENQAHVLVKDLFKEEETIYIIVAAGDIGKLLGKGGETVKRLQQKLGKRIKAIEYDDEVDKFVKNIIYPLQVEEIVCEDSVICLKDSQKKTKSLLIGRNGRNLKIINRAVRRFFNVEVKVV